MIAMVHTVIEYDKFLAVLRDTLRRWTKAGHNFSDSVQAGALWLDREESSGTDCPWLAVNDRLGMCLVVERDGVDMTGAILAAADNRHGHDPNVRADLLAACGLAQLAVIPK